jgi:hypothetical protein
MNPHEFVAKVKSLFNEETISAPSVDAFAEYELKDGGKITIDNLEIGGKVVLEDGTPAPVGEHILIDGTSIQVDENGVIVEISSPMEDTMPEEETPTANDMKVAELEAEIKALKETTSEKMNAFEVANKEMFSKFESAILTLASAIEGIANAPTADPVDAPKNKFSHVESKDAKVAKFLQLTKSITK